MQDEKVVGESFVSALYKKYENNDKSVSIVKYLHIITE